MRAHVVSAYADDILYVQDLEDTYEPLPSIFYNFQQLSGLQINEHKSYVFSFNDNVGGEVTRFGSLTFQLAQTTFKYLGIQIYRESQKMLDGNLLKAITALRAQVTFWITLPLSVPGRVTLGKMVMLPRLLYFFTNLQVMIPRSVFQLVDTMLIELIWGAGRIRIS